MINKTQEYANDTGTNWMPSIEVISKINLAIGNLSRRGVLVIADSVANQRERLSKNLEEIKKFKEDLETLGNLFLSYEHLMIHAIYNGLDVNWLLEAEIPQNIVAIHKEIRANGFLK